MIEKTTRYAEIPQLRKGVAFSDPYYNGSEWCQYRKEFQASGWVMKMATKRVEENYIDIEIQVGRKTALSGLSVMDREEEGHSVLHYSHYDTKQTELGIDTARIFIGSLENFENFGEAASIYTAADGLFGEAWEFTCKGEKDPAGFLVMGSVDADVTSETELHMTVMSAFDGREIDKTRYEQLTNPNNLDLRMELAKEARAAVISEQGKDKPAKNKGELER